MLEKHGSERIKIDSIVLVTENALFVKSDAVLQICRSLSGLAPYIYILHFVPKSFRDIIYDWVAKNRYSWFGKRDVCMIPTAELESRFLT